MDEDDEYIDIQLRTPEEIAARLFITEALTLRLVVEDQWQMGEEPDDGPDEIFFDLKRTLREAKMTHALSQKDKHLLTTKFGRISSHDLTMLMNQTLAADSIAMFCGLIPWRPFWAIVDQESHYRLNLEEDSIRSVADRLQLPTDEEAALAQEVAELWTWRMFQEMALRNATGIEQIAIRVVIGEAMKEAEMSGLITLDGDGDLSMDDKPVSAIDDQSLVVLSMFAMMREKSISWLCGMGPNWDRVPSINA